MRVAVLVTLMALPCFGARPVAPYHQKADKIIHILKREGARPNREAIAMTLKAIDLNIPKYPKMKLTAHDWYALAMQESRFNEKCLGSVGERGIFQIRPEYYHGKTSITNPFVNTALAFKIMYSKLREHHWDKRKGITGYNGYVVHNGKLKDGYYVAVMRQLRRVANV